MERVDTSAWTVPANRPVIIAGPCAAESREQVLRTAEALSRVPGISLFRAGLWKPRTSPGSFEGVGEAGLDWLVEVQERYGLRACTEVALARHVEEALARGLRAVWIGARTTGSPFAVQELAEALRGTDLAVLVKNPLSPDVGLWLGAIDRFQRVGIRDLAAVHRGFASRSPTRFRFSPMWRLPLELRRTWPALPVLCDPSHIAGRQTLVGGVAQAAIDLGMDGLMIEVHEAPASALSDAGQQLTPAAFEELLTHLVLRAPFSQDDEFQAQLEALRRELDDVDAEILAALARRWTIVARVARTKLEGGVIAFQLDRMCEVLARWRQGGDELGLPGELVEDVYLAVHEAAVDEQTQLMRSANGSDDGPSEE